MLLESSGGNKVAAGRPMEGVLVQLYRQDNGGLASGTGEGLDLRDIQEVELAIVDEGDKMFVLTLFYFLIYFLFKYS